MNTRIPHPSGRAVGGIKVWQGGRLRDHDSERRVINHSIRVPRVGGSMAMAMRKILEPGSVSTEHSLNRHGVT